MRVKTEGAGADSTATGSSTGASAACPTDNGGITLPAGFCATVFADTIGHARHIVVNSNGDVYVNTWSGRYYTTPAHPGGFLVAMRDTNSDGKADIIKRFGPDSLRGNLGGTGIGIYNGSLYAEESSVSAARIVRYPISNDSMDSRRRHPKNHRRGPSVSVAHDAIHSQSVGGDLYYELRVLDQLSQVKEAHDRVAGEETVHRAAYSRRYLAIRCEQDESAVLTRGAIRDRHSQRGRHCLRSRWSALRDAARPRSAP